MLEHVSKEQRREKSLEEYHCGISSFSHRRCMKRDIVVQGNPRVYKALRNRLDAVYAELCRIEAGTGVDPDLLAIIRMMAEILNGLKGGSE